MGAKVVAEDHPMNVGGPAVPSYTQLESSERVVTGQRGTEALRRPDGVETLRHYVRPELVVSSSFHHTHGQDVHQRPLAARLARGPPVKLMDHHQVSSMKCETCSRPAMFVCSACRKAPYCSVDCQVYLIYFTLYY